MMSMFFIVVKASVASLIQASLRWWSWVKFISWLSPFVEWFSPFTCVRMRPFSSWQAHFLISRFSRFFSASRYYFDTLLALWYIYFPPSSFLIKSTFTFCFSPDLCLSPLGPDFCTKINRDAPWKVDQNRYRPLPKRCLRNQSHFFCMYLLPTRIS